MKSISRNPKSYIINGKPDFLISGEFHYFRVPYSDWERRLKLFKEAGGNCVSTYIPWILHEPEEGRFCFGDIPERDLEGFLKLCHKMELAVVCRPGPYQYSEMRYAGLPGWLCENYPEILARNINGIVFNNTSVSYLHPVFLEKVKRWFNTVCPILAEYIVSRGGPVAFAQIDNELMGIHEWSGSWDYHTEAMGIGKEDGRYPDFLKKRYLTLEALNIAYGTRFKSFSDVFPAEKTENMKVEERRRVKDYQDFYFSTVAEYAEILVNWMRDDGIDCDIIHNSGNPYMNSYFLETVSKLGKKFLLGSDHYYNLNMDWEQNNPTPQYASKVFYSNEMLRLMGYPATVFELPGGSCADWPPITSVDLEACYMVNTALGMKGFNYYIFTGGYNPQGIGQFGDDYDFGASVASDGTIRPHYNTQKKFGKFLSENTWLASAEQVCDFYAGIDWDHTRSRYYFSGGGDNEFCNTSAWDFLRKGVLITAMCASYALNMADLKDGKSLMNLDKPLFVPTSVCMALEVQKNLVDFVKSGGMLLLAPVIPYMDENFNKCELLKDFLYGAEVENCKKASPTVNVGPVHNVLMNGTLWSSVIRPEKAVKIAGEENTGAEIGWHLSFQGGGRVIWLGLQWQHAKFEHMHMLKYLLGLLNCRNPVVESTNPNIWTSLRSDGKKYMLFLMNLFTSPMNTRIRLLQENGLYTETKEYKPGPMEVMAIEVRRDA